MKFLGYYFSLIFFLLGIFGCTKKQIRFPAAAKFAYITNFSSAFDINGPLLKCSVNADTGQLNNCINQVLFPLPILPVPAPFDIQIHTFGMQVFAYVTIPNDVVNPTLILQCELDSNAQFIGCIDAIFPLPVAQRPSNPDGLKFRKTSHGTVFAYVVSTGIQKVFKCEMNKITGNFMSCADTGGSFTNPAEINFYNNGTQSFAYISEFSNGFMKCLVDSAGNFSNCIPVKGLPIHSGASWTSVSFLTLANTSYAYAVNRGNNNIELCNIDLNGDFMNCVDSGGVFNRPYMMNFLKIKGDTFGYVTNQAFMIPPPALGNTVVQCKADPLTGKLTQCIDSGAGQLFVDPLSITFY